MATVTASSARKRHSARTTGGERVKRNPLRLGSVLDWAAFVALLIQVTELQRPVGVLAGIDSTVVNLVFTGAFALYALVRRGHLTAFVNRRLGRLWLWAVYLLFVLVLGLQFLAGSVSGSRAAYWAGFALLFATAMLAAAALWNRHGPAVTQPFFLWAIALSWFGFAVNFVNYGFIREVQVGTSNALAASDTYTRIVGFYQHPNMAGFALCLFLALLVTDEKFMRSSVLVHALVLSAAIGGVATTGSRTSLLLLAIVVAWYIITLARMPGMGSLTVARVVAAPALLVGGGLAVFNLFGSIVGSDSPAYTNVVERISSISGRLAGDESVGLRVGIIDQYLKSIGEQPMLGHGPEYVGHQLASGTFTNVSQIAWLEWAGRSGLVYAGVVAVAFIATLVAARRVRERDWNWRRGSLLIGLLTVASFSIVDLLWLRAPVVAIGSLLGILFMAVPAGDGSTDSRIRSVRRSARTGRADAAAGSQRRQPR